VAKRLYEELDKWEQEEKYRVIEVLLEYLFDSVLQVLKIEDAKRAKRSKIRES
jgi:hypothetical protein